METGAITGYIDVAQIALYVFWAFFAGLIYYLHKENKREGYPLESDRSQHIRVQGWPAIPEAKTFALREGGTALAPKGSDPQHAIAGRPMGAWPGAPLVPTGDPMDLGIGPGSYALRADVVDTTFEGDARIVPLRAAKGFGVADGDPDPRGMPVIGADGQVGGTVRDLWVDRAEMLFRYLEIDVPNAAKGPQVLLPINFAVVGERDVKVQSVLGAQIAGVPRTKHPDQVTLLEEEKIMAYYGAGTLYATAARAEPLL